MKPRLASASHAADFVACAAFLAVAPQFRPAWRMWRPDSLLALAQSLEILERERDALSSQS